MCCLGTRACTLCYEHVLVRIRTLVLACVYALVYECALCLWAVLPKIVFDAASEGAQQPTPHEQAESSLEAALPSLCAPADIGDLAMTFDRSGQMYYGGDDSDSKSSSYAQVRTVIEGHDEPLCAALHKQFRAFIAALPSKRLEVRLLMFC